MCTTRPRSGGAFSWSDGTSAIEDALVADLRHTTEISRSMRTLCSAEDYGDNLSESEPCEPSDVHHAARIRWGWGPMQDLVERAALVAGARSQLGRDLKAAQVKRERSDNLNRVCTEANRRAAARQGPYSIYQHLRNEGDYMLRTAKAAPPHTSHDSPHFK